ncbi:Hypothetical protein NGAL_HAMBI1146_00210 [Neorhizobium galegae bv. officinalis]|nr:Hypothetical protein NGAL_HAMBI1146_00210 [Neorhizobium galegae bv. officinalis]
MSAEAKVHVFTAMFEANEDASAFGHPHWEPEPNGDASDDEYAAWEDRNPIWPLKSELGHRLDSDFIEVIWKSGQEPDWDYLRSRLHDTDVTEIEKSGTPANTFVLVDQTAFGDDEVELRSTPNLTYHGSYPSLR